MALVWKTFKISSDELSLVRVLRCGQAFRWKNINNVWSCSMNSKVLFLKQLDGEIYYSSLGSGETSDLDLLKDYFNLDINLTSLYTQWNKLDPVFAKSSLNFQGIRMLRQNPWENLISFICSSNNNIKRISMMCDNLCLHFGDFIVHHEGIDYYSFPKPEALVAPDTEAKLRDLGFGYRAKYIYETSKLVHESKFDLFELRSKPYEEVHQHLLGYKGVGPKVADCVCLMSMDKHDAIPVDTHVYQIAKRDYKLKGGKGENVNKETYQLIRKFFIDKWGPYAGWAQSVMFASDLRDLENGVNEVAGVEVKKRKITKKVVKKEEILILDIPIVDEIEYSNTGRPKRRRTIKVEA